MSASHRRMVRREEGTWRKLQPEKPGQETHQPLLSSLVTSPQPARPGVTSRPQQETAKQLERQREARTRGQAPASGESGRAATKHRGVMHLTAFCSASEENRDGNWLKPDPERP